MKQLLAKEYILNSSPLTRNRFKRYFREYGATDGCIEVLEGALRFDPNERLTAEQLINCEYYREIVEEEMEDKDGPGEEGVDLPYEDFAFEDSPCTADAMRREILKEIVWNQTKDNEILDEQGMHDDEAKDWSGITDELPISLPLLKTVSEVRTESLQVEKQRAEKVRS